MHTVIIGGGAAGVAAAIAAAERGHSVTVLERNRKPLKKLGVTGNGRANLLNAGVPVYYGDTAFALAALRRLGYGELRAFFASLGVPLREEEEGRIYPAALLASVVAEALLLRAAQRGVRWVTGARAVRLAREGGAFTVHALLTEPEADARKGGAPKRGAQPAAETPFTLRTDRVVLAAGGAAAPVHGTDGGAYALPEPLGHRVTAIRPALCALLTDKRRLSGLAGQRARARLRLLGADGRELHASQGEVLFAEDAVSGIAAMQLARFAQPGARVALDLRPAACWDGGDSAAAGGRAGGETAPSGRGDMAGGGAASGAGEPTDGPADVAARILALADVRQDCPVGELFTGVFAAPVSGLLYREAGLRDLGQRMPQLTGEQIARLADTLCGLTLPITGTRGFEQAQVTAGGLETAAFDPTTMESRLCPGLYAAGEILDVDGDCGGFNLMFAFASGLIAGSAP